MAPDDVARAIRVVCTAGHVDHGKSTLVAALTGTDPDRLQEEQRRGLTIDLGFAWADLVDDVGQRPTLTAAFVDLPGHERFVGNMLAGAGGVDLALLVVAADEGWMPQSSEHLAILDLLGVRHGLVAVTKTDLVDDETTALAVELVREELAGTTLADADVQPVSASTGEGLGELRGKLHALMVDSPAGMDAGRPRLWIDRAFSITGAGTVVTGTLQGGRLRVGDIVEVLPTGRTSRIRGLQQLEVDTEQAEPGTRVAVNLTGLDVAEVPRGTALCAPGQWRPAAAVEGRLRTLPGTSVGRRGAWKFHAGSGVWNAKVTPLDVGTIEDGASGMVRVELDAPVPLGAGDRFVLRDTGRRRTAGGGIVLDAMPPRRPRGRAARDRRAIELDARRHALEADDRIALAALHVRERDADHAAATAAATGLLTSELVGQAGRHGFSQVGDMLASDEAMRRWSAAAVDTLRAHHAAHPVERAARRDVPTRAMVAAGCDPGLVPTVLDALVETGVLAAEGPGLRTPEHAPVLDDAHVVARRSLLDALESARFAPPRIEEAAGRAGASVALLREMEQAGDLVRLSSDIAVTASTLRSAHEVLRATYEEEGPLTAARAKEALGTSRRVAVPLLEEMDRRRLTRRVGDVREVAPVELG